LRSQFGGSTLVSLLASWVDVDVKATRQDIAERLGTGLSVADAMSLYAVLQTLAAPLPSSLHRAACQHPSPPPRLAYTSQVWHRLKVLWRSDTVASCL
jgi:hypothetical protein